MLLCSYVSMRIIPTMHRCRDQGKKWCDFVLFTTKGISVERIAFNEDYWEKHCYLNLLTSTIIV